MSEYLKDEHLEFLKELPENDLNALAEVLSYKRNNNIPKWKGIATEIQTYGGDTVANSVRGHGVLYKEILQDACGQLKISKADDVYEMENRLLTYTLNKYLEDKTAQEIIEIAKNIDLEDKEKVNTVLLKIASKDTISMFSIKLIQQIIYKTILYTSIKRAIGQSLFKRILINIGVRQVATRQVAAWAGPIGWVIGGLTMIPVVSGPAYRITIPACIHIACLRRKHLDALLEKNCNIYAERG